MITLIDNPKTNRLCESFQANDIKFAFTQEKEDGHQLLTTWMKCREYFNEFLVKNYHPDEFDFTEVHGFVYDHKKFPMDMNQTTIALRFPNMKTADAFQANVGIIHKIEEFNKIDSLTEILPTKDKSIFVVKASKFWQQKALLLNLYTLMIKLCALDFPTKSIDELNKHYTSQQAPTELTYLSQVGVNKIDNLLKNLVTIAEIPTKYVDGSDILRDPYGIHANSGIYAAIKNYTTEHTKSFFNALRKIAEEKKPMQFLGGV